MKQLIARPAVAAAGAWTAVYLLAWRLVVHIRQRPATVSVSEV
jgi:hypothetical protein